MTDRSNQNTAAGQLKGLTLGNGWVVTERFEAAPGATGGRCSQSYLAKKGDKTAFLKAIDLSEALDQEGDTIRFVRELTEAYEHERGVLLKCRDRNFSRVVTAIDHGEVRVPGMDGVNALAFYLIFELAEGDVRSQVSEAKRLDTIMSLLVLKDVALGLSQVHSVSIAHQDIKPSNVLQYPQSRFRIADFGRSSTKGESVWYDRHNIAGDTRYAPPEQLFGYTHPDFAFRRIGCDLFMLGNLTAFMFTGMNVTARLLSRLDPQFHHTRWSGTYEQALPHLQTAFSDILQELGRNVDPDVRAEIVEIIRQLCTPDLLRRGHPRGIGTHTQHSLQRYVSVFERMAMEQRLKKSIRSNRKPA